MKIKYEMSDHNCLIKCPNGKAYKVNSHSCQKCEHFVMRDIDKKIVECSYEESNTNVVFKKCFPRNCGECVLNNISRNCFGMLFKFGIDCLEENCHVEIKKEFVQCTKENTKVGDVVYLKEEDPHELWIVKYVSKSGHSGRYHDDGWDFIIGTDKLGDYPDQFKNYVIEK